MTKEVERAIEEAQLVLVGLGTEWEMPADRWKENPLYASLAAQTEGSGPFEQYLCFHDLEHNPDLEKKKAYQKLGQLLQGKNYFIVSLCRDDLIYGSGLDEGRIVTPCGGFRALQCENGCPLCGESGLLKEDVQKTVLRAVDEALAAGKPKREAFPFCPSCQKPLWFNRISSPAYREEGYLPQWEKYTKWLQGTLNRDLCILELGAGMQFPQIIRFPFEKVAYFNQKARFFRVHSRLYQMTEELGEKGVSIAKNSVEFLLEESE